MIKYTRINNITHPLFKKAWALYTVSFPPEERRLVSTQQQIMSHPLYHFEVITKKTQLLGILLWWGFDDVRYIEHLATQPLQRDKGYGSGILNHFMAQSKIPILLEVEHPTEEINRRRIGFYQRAGFVLNPHHIYSHPPYQKDGADVSLMLMSWPQAITDAALEHFVGKHHLVIHRFVL